MCERARAVQPYTGTLQGDVTVRLCFPPVPVPRLAPWLPSAARRRVEVLPSFVNSDAHAARPSCRTEGKKKGENKESISSFLGFCCTRIITSASFSNLIAEARPPLCSVIQQNALTYFLDFLLLGKCLLSISLSYLF